MGCKVGLQREGWPGDTKDTGAGRKLRSPLILMLQLTEEESEAQVAWKRPRPECDLEGGAKQDEKGN